MFRQRVGLEGADSANKGYLKEAMDSLAMESKLKTCFGALDVGDERRGVTGALFDIRRGGRLEAIELQRNENGWEVGFMSFLVGLCKAEEEGLGWYEGIGL